MQLDECLLRRWWIHDFPEPFDGMEVSPFMLYAVSSGSSRLML
jgi:hypothetical protein